jgi:hypothetical protein
VSARQQRAPSLSFSSLTAGARVSSSSSRDLSLRPKPSNWTLRFRPPESLELSQIAPQPSSPLSPLVSQETEPVLDENREFYLKPNPVKIWKFISKLESVLAPLPPLYKARNAPVLSHPEKREESQPRRVPDELRRDKPPLHAAKLNHRFPVRADHASKFPELWSNSPKLPSSSSRFGSSLHQARRRPFRPFTSPAQTRPARTT